MPADMVDVCGRFAPLPPSSKRRKHALTTSGAGGEALRAFIALPNNNNRFSRIWSFLGNRRATPMLRARLRTKMLLNMFRRDRCATTMICLQGMALRIACDRYTLRMSHCVVKPFPDLPSAHSTQATLLTTSAGGKRCRMTSMTVADHAHMYAHSHTHKHTIYTHLHILPQPSPPWPPPPPPPHPPPPLRPSTGVGRGPARGAGTARACPRRHRPRGTTRTP